MKKQLIKIRVKKSTAKVSDFSFIFFISLPQYIFFTFLVRLALMTEIVSSAFNSLDFSMPPTLLSCSYSFYFKFISQFLRSSSWNKFMTNAAYLRIVLRSFSSICMKIYIREMNPFVTLNRLVMKNRKPNTIMPDCMIKRYITRFSIELQLIYKESYIIERRLLSNRFMEGSMQL